MDATEYELVKTTPAGAAVVAFARLCNEGITEFCQTGAISKRTMSLMVDFRNRLAENEDAARLLNDAAIRTMLVQGTMMVGVARGVSLGDHAKRMYEATYGNRTPTTPGVLA